MNESEAPAEDLASLLASLGERPDVEEVLGAFKPPRRFARKTFENYHPTDPSQRAAAERLSRLARQIASAPARRWLPRRWSVASHQPAGGIYLDGGFGVGKTHLLAALWNAALVPRAFLSFDELMYFIGLAGSGPAARAFARYRLIAIDEWELDDPGNLKMALAFLRATLRSGAFVAVTSNTLPLELGAGRFSQKDFQSEIEELASAFEVVRISGADYRQRRFPARPGTGRTLRSMAITSSEDEPADDLSPGAEPPAAPSVRGSFPESTRADGDVVPPLPDELSVEASSGRSDRILRVDFRELTVGLGSVHPIRYREIARRIDLLVVRDIEALAELPDALRWVHFVDSIYEAGVRVVAVGRADPERQFPPESLEGPYGRKLARCVSRMMELLGDGGINRAGRSAEVA